AALDRDWMESAEVQAAAGGLIDKLLDPADEVRKGTMAAVARLGRAVVPALIAALGHGDRVMRQRAADALASLRPKACEAAPALRKALQDEHVWVRDAARRALERIGAVSELSLDSHAAG